MTDAFQAFLEEPTPDSYRRIRRITMAAPKFERSSFELTELDALCEAGQFEEAWRRVQAMEPRWRLSPRFHFLAGYAASCLGDEEEVELARFQFQTCLEGILSTGDGSEKAPYEVVRICDEYDVLRALGREPCGQCMVERQGRCMDVISCDDGSEIWFDVGRLKRDRRPSRPASRWADRIPSQTAYPR